MNAVLPKNLEDFVDQQVKEGRYQNASAVLQDALARLERKVRNLPRGDNSTRELEDAYVAETTAERDWENRTADSSSERFPRANYCVVNSLRPSFGATSDLT